MRIPNRQRAATWLAGLCCVWPCARFSLGQRPVCPAQWSVDYSIVGGVAGLHQHILLRQNGIATVDAGGSGASFPIDSERLRAICRLLEHCDVYAPQRSQAPYAPNVADAIFNTITVTRDGHSCGMGTDEKALLSVLAPLLREDLQKAEVERWRRAGPFKMGRVWRVEEEVRNSNGQWSGELWKGTWTPRKGSNILDAVWHNNQSGQEIRDTVILDSAVRGSIIMHRVASPMKYQGTYLAERPEEIHGTVGPDRSASWTVEISY